MDDKGTVEKLKAWPERVKDYVGELRQEMRRVTWPSRKQVESTTAVVIISVFAFAAYFYIVDRIMSAGVSQITHLAAR